MMANIETLRVTSDENVILNGDDVGTSKQNGSVPAEQADDGVHEVDRYGFFGGAQYTDPNSESRVPLSVLREREVKWLDMLENWEKWMSKRFKKVKERCRKGIPPAIRGRAWQFLCGSKYKLDSNKGLFESLLALPGDPKCIDDIRKDLHRQFPYHEMFSSREGSGQQDLFNVLKAYSIHNPREGYCQAHAPIAAILLMHMPAEQAFWCFTSICDKYIPGYYSTGLEQVQLDGQVLFALVKKVLPATYKHLQANRVDPVLYMMEWFMCLYTRTLPWRSVLRVLDMFFCEGVKVLFRVALVILKNLLGTSAQIAECPSLYEIVERLKHIPSEISQEDFLIEECGKLPISERDMEREHQKELAASRSKKNKSTRNGNSTPDS